MGPSVPAHIQRFEVVELLGTGAMGAVYRARDPHLGRDVAVKVLARPTGAASAHLSLHNTVDLRGGSPAGELLTEAQMMARLSHPNVLPIYEVGLSGGEMFLVMEYIPGSDLRRWLLAEERSIPAVVALFVQAARGLAAAHAHGIVHGDFKPENVLIGDDGRARVADFGLSRLASQGLPPIRVEQQIGGTPYYMAPELWKGAGQSVAADVFAFCTALAEGLGADPPAQNRIQLDQALRARGVGGRLRGVVADGLADDPAARPSLDRVLAALAGHAAPRRWRIAAIAGAGVAAGVAALALLQQPDPAAACAASPARFAGPWAGPGRAALEASGAAGEVDRLRGMLKDSVGAVCEAETSGEITRARAVQAASCVERRGFELDAIAARVAADRLNKEDAIDLAEVLPTIRDCFDIQAPPITADRSAVAGLYRRLVAIYAVREVSPARVEAAASLEKDARASGERELEARAAVLTGMRQIETDRLTDADASLARAHDVATSISAAVVALDSLVRRATVAANRQDPSAAHTYSKLAFELASARGEPGDIAFTGHSLARSLLAIGQPAQAIELADKVLAPGPAEEWLPRTLARLKIAALHQLGRREQALALARQEAEATRQKLGEGDPDYAVSLDFVAGALFDTGDREGALAMRQRALAVVKKALPADHSLTLAYRMSVAGNLVDVGRFEEGIAEARAVQAVADENESSRASRPELTVALGSILFWSGQVDEGLRLHEEGLDGLLSQSGQDHPDNLAYRAERVAMNLELGEWDDAERGMAALERSYRARKDQGEPLALLEGVYRARLALARRDPDKAEALTRAALAGWEELHGSDEGREDLLRTLGASLVDQGRWAQALDTLAAATTIARGRHQLPDRLALIQVERARALAGAGRRAEALAVARQARDALRRFPGHLRARAAIDALLTGRR